MSTCGTVLTDCVAERSNWQLRDGQPSFAATRKFTMFSQVVGKMQQHDGTGKCFSAVI